jgi:hypothetical protein
MTGPGHERGNRAMDAHRPADIVSGSFARLADRSGLGSQAEQLVQLPGPDSRDQGIDHRRELVLGRDDDAGLTLLELDGLGPELDRHNDLSGRVSLPPGPDRLLLGRGLPLPVDLGPSLDGPNVVGILQEQLLLLQLGDELGSASLDGIVPGPGKRGE